MPNIVKTTLDNGGVIAPGASYKTRPELITFTGVATLLAGCILARDTSTMKMVPYVKGGVANGNGVPDTVLLYPVTSTGAGDVMSDVLIRGDVRKERLVINADGTDANIDGAVIDQLRARGITPLTTKQLAVLDP